MTFEKLEQLINKYNISKDVTLMSDSGWECDATDMDGVFYNKEENVIVFTQYDWGDDDYEEGYIGLRFENEKKVIEKEIDIKNLSTEDVIYEFFKGEE